MNNQDLPLALQIGASAFHHHDQAKLDAVLAELSPYQTLADILHMFRDALPDDRSCTAEAVLWGLRCAVIIADKDKNQLLNFIDQMANEIDNLHKERTLEKEFNHA